MGRSIQDMLDAGEISTFNPKSGEYKPRTDMSNKARESPIVWTYSILINHKIGLAKQELKRQQELLNIEIFKEQLTDFLNTQTTYFLQQSHYFTAKITYENKTFKVE